MMQFHHRTCGYQLETLKKINSSAASNLPGRWVESCSQSIAARAADQRCRAPTWGQGISGALNKYKYLGTWLPTFFQVENCLPGKFTHRGEIPGMLEKTWLPGFTPSYPIFNLFPHVLSTASKAKNPLCALEVTF